MNRQKQKIETLLEKSCLYSESIPVQREAKKMRQLIKQRYLTGGYEIGKCLGAMESTLLTAIAVYGERN